MTDGIFYEALSQIVQNLIITDFFHRFFRKVIEEKYNMKFLFIMVSNFCPMGQNYDQSNCSFI